LPDGKQEPIYLLADRQVEFSVGYLLVEEGATKTRERILDVALDLFVEQGYDKTSLRELAERMGFTKAALYYHFPSKADILRALHERMHALLEGPMTLLDQGPASLDNYEKFLDACVDGIQANQKLFMLHRVNQAALAKIHIEGHDGTHQELEERARKLFSDPALSAAERLRMTAGFAVAFITPMMNVFFMDPSMEEEIPLQSLKDIVHQVLRASN
jgi:AcrR family transcriptional regulator